MWCVADNTLYNSIATKYDFPPRYLGDGYMKITKSRSREPGSIWLTEINRIIIWLICVKKTDTFAMLIRLCYTTPICNWVTTLSLAPSLPPSKLCAIDL